MMEDREFFETSLTCSGRDRLVLLPKNPGRLFAFWQLTRQRADLFRSGAYEPRVSIRLYLAGDKSPAGELECRWDSFKAYLEVPEPGRDYFAALFVARPGGQPERLAESNQAASPGAAAPADAGYGPFRKVAP